MEDPRMAFSFGAGYSNSEFQSTEGYLRFDFPQKYGRIGHAAGISYSNEKDLWIGYGITWKEYLPDTPIYLQFHLMPGMQWRGEGVELGGPIEVRSGIEVGFEAPKGLRMGVSFDHRSNGEMYDENPGLDTVQFRVSLPL